MKPFAFQNGILEAFTFRVDGKVENHQDDGMVFFKIFGRHFKMPYKWLQLMSADSLALSFCLKFPHTVS